MIGWTKVAKEYVDKLGNKWDTILLAGQGRKKNHKRQPAKIKEFFRQCWELRLRDSWKGCLKNSLAKTVLVVEFITKTRVKKTQILRLKDCHF